MKATRDTSSPSWSASMGMNSSMIIAPGSSPLVWGCQ
ncbi:Uncharacterised protein [Mycobacteroides abscessus subsp. abscessus]|nr:Uncharacterised protein [Mycobacteroides abscessus subsp. abscessus]SKV01056.1 Uncharacterised protein [Mycobacteroides abscessus subsp. abscessus]